MDEKRAVPSDHEQRKQYQFEVRRIFLHDSQKVPVKYVKKDLKYPWNAHKEYARLLLIQSDEVRGKRVENRFPVQEISFVHLMAAGRDLIFARLRK